MSNGTQRDLSGWQKTRPVRIAFLVEVSKYADLTLDAVFANCYGRWGGRFNLIVPCVDGAIVAEYWPWLETFDPDIVYSYVDLPPAGVLEIHERLVPAHYFSHVLHGKEAPDERSFRPRIDVELLSSMSTIFRLARHSPVREGTRVKIIDSWHTEEASRLLRDNIGTYRSSAANGMYPNDALESASLLTIVSDKYFEDRQYAVPRDLDRMSTEYDALNEFSSRRATSVSLLSSIYATRLDIRDPDWSGAFNLVIGESFEDRLLFWNARLLIPSWLDNDLCCFRVSSEELKEQQFVDLLARLINTRNHVNGGTGGQPILKIRSASHDADFLAGVLDRLRKSKLWNPASVEVIPGGHARPSQDSLRHARESVQSSLGFGAEAGSREFRWTAPLARPPVIAPEHLQDAPPNQVFTLGEWAVDLGFEHDQDSPRMYRGNQWVLPKRWRMAGAFSSKFVTQSFSPRIKLSNRTSKRGSLTVFAGLKATLESVAVPTVAQAVRYAFCEDAAFRNLGSNEPPWPGRMAEWISPSNEAQHLVGVLGLTGGLSRASILLLHPFLQRVFADLGGTPNLADTDLNSTANALAKKVNKQPLFDIREERDRVALAALIVKAAQSIKAPRMHVGLESLRQNWNDYIEAYWLKHKNERANEDDTWDERERNALDQALTEMRTRRMIFQGVPWKCDACQHRNWTDFQALQSTIACDVCSSQKELPVGFSWHFRPNEFLIESLRSHSVLSLVWILACLSRRARESFVYVGPTCFGFGNDYNKSDAEADLLAILDGEAVLCEIKSAWRSLRTADLANFLSLAKRLRPNRAILAVMEEGERLHDELEDMRKALNEVGIKFELLTPSQCEIDDAPYLLLSALD